VGSITKGFMMEVDNLPNDALKNILTVKYNVSDACTNSDAGSKILLTENNSSKVSATQYSFTITQTSPALAVDMKRVGCKLSLWVEIKNGAVTLISKLYPYKSHGLLVVGREQLTQETIIVADTPSDITFNGIIPGHVSTSVDVVAWIPKKQTMTNSDCANVPLTEMFEVEAADDKSKWSGRVGQSINIASFNQQAWERVLCYSFAGEPPIIYQNHVLYVRHLIDIQIVPVNEVGIVEGKGSLIKTRIDSITDTYIDGVSVLGRPRKVISMRLANKPDTNIDEITNDIDFVQNKYNWNVQLLLPEWVTTKGTTTNDKLKLVPYGETCDYSVSDQFIEFTKITQVDLGSSDTYSHQLLPAETAAATATAATKPAVFYDLNGRPPKEDTSTTLSWESNNTWLGGYQLCYQHSDTISTPNYATNPHVLLEATCDEHYWGPFCARCPGFNRKINGANGTCSDHGICIGSGSHLDVTLKNDFVYYLPGTEGGGKYKLGECACNLGNGINTGWDGQLCDECSGATKTERWLSSDKECKSCGFGFQRGKVTTTSLNSIIQGMSRDGYGGNKNGFGSNNDDQEACVKCAPSYFGNKEECIMCPTLLPNGQPFQKQCSGHGTCKNSGENPPEFLDYSLDQLKAVKNDTENPVCTCRAGSGFVGLECGDCEVGWYFQGGVACVQCEEFPERCLGGRDKTRQCIDGYAGDKCLECSRLPAHNSTSPRNGYYKLGRICEPCPENDIVLILIICALIIVVIIMLLFIYKIAQTKLPLAPIASAIRHMQFMSFFIQIQLPYPKELLDMYNYITSIFSFNFADMTSPECIVETSYLEEWIVYTSGPLVLGK
jgi:hypothetical protein